MTSLSHTCTNWCKVRAYLRFFVYMLSTIVPFTIWAKDLPNDVWRLVLAFIMFLIPMMMIILDMFYTDKLTRSLINRRDALSFDEWYGHFYPENPELPPNLVKEILETIASVRGVESTKLRPSDRLFFELGAPHSVWDDYLELYGQALEQLIRKHSLNPSCFKNPTDSNPISSITLDYIIRDTVAQLLQRNHNQV